MLRGFARVPLPLNLACWPSQFSPPQSLRSVTPFFATLARIDLSNAQFRVPLSPLAATLAELAFCKSFACHSYGKRWGVRYGREDFRTGGRQEIGRSDRGSGEAGSSTVERRDPKTPHAWTACGAPVRRSAARLRRRPRLELGLSGRADGIQCRTYGAWDFLVTTHPALTHGANLCRASGAGVGVGGWAGGEERRRSDWRTGTFSCS